LFAGAGRLTTASARDQGYYLHPDEAELVAGLLAAGDAWGSGKE
jgi:hypothetical protein